MKIHEGATMRIKIPNENLSSKTLAKWIWTNQKESDTATYNWTIEKSKFRKADFDFSLNNKFHFSIIKLNDKELTLGKCEGQHPMKKLKYWYFRDWKKSNYICCSSR